MPIDPGGSELARAIEGLPLIDHHVHSALRTDAPHDRAAFEGLLTESDRLMPDWMTQFDSPRVSS